MTPESTPETAHVVRQIRETIHRHRMLTGGETVVVAVSGGADSTALARGLAALAAELALTLHIAHLNHGLRPGADEDAAFVAELSRALQLEHHAGVAAPRALAEREGLSLEDAARRLRYDFLRRVAEDTGATAVATGHTLDDQAETVLLRLLRGSGLDGLTGIPPVRRMGGVLIIRPLIEVTRADVEAYLRDGGAAWRDDPTNRDLGIVRNRIRLVLLPVLEGYNADVRRMLARTAGLLRDDAEAIAALAAPRIAEALSADLKTVRIAREPFAGLPVALQRRAVREAVRRVEGNTRGLGFVHIEEARRLVLEGRVGSWLPLPSGIRMHRLRSGVELTVESGDRAPSEYLLPVPGRVVALEFGVHLAAEMVSRERLETACPPAADRGDAVVLDAASVGNEMVVRAPQPGDRFAPAGMGGRTKLVADFLRDEKVSRHRRGTVAVLIGAGGAILWLVGLRASETGRVSPATTRAVRVTARPLVA